MRRAGENWTPNYSDVQFNVLMSDFAYPNGWGESFLLTNHRGPEGSTREDGNLSNNNFGIRYELGQEANANFALDDGSVATYYFDYNSVFSGGTFTGIRRQGSGTYMVPTELGRGY